MTKKMTRAYHIIIECQFGQIIAWDSVDTARPAAWCSVMSGGCSSSPNIRNGVQSSAMTLTRTKVRSINASISGGLLISWVN